MKFTTQKLSVILLSSAILTACGGGGSGSSEKAPAPTPPVAEHLPEPEDQPMVPPVVEIPPVVEEPERFSLNSFTSNEPGVIKYNFNIEGADNKGGIYSGFVVNINSNAFVHEGVMAIRNEGMITNTYQTSGVTHTYTEMRIYDAYNGTPLTGYYLVEPDAWCYITVAHAMPATVQHGDMIVGNTVECEYGVRLVRSMQVEVNEPGIAEIQISSITYDLRLSGSPMVGNSTTTYYIKPDGDILRAVGDYKNIQTGFHDEWHSVD